MKFLTLLSGSKPHRTERTGFIPSIQATTHQTHHILPDKDNCYHRDTNIILEGNVTAYKLYRNSLFESVQTCPDIQETQNVSICLNLVLDRYTGTTPVSPGIPD